MKRTKLMLPVLLLTLLTIGACKKSILDLPNPNEPGPDALKTENGIKRAGLGIYNKFGLDYWWLTLGYHDIMGDSYFISAGNFSWRWANQTAKITLSNGTVLTPPQGGLQSVELRARNDRSFGDDNAFIHEWSSCYAINNQANMLLDALKDPALKFNADGDVKKKIVAAWAYWWKGFSYSRLGSMYVSGLINDETGKTTGNFVLNTALLTEANKNFDLAAAQLQGVAFDDTYKAFLTAMIPDFVGEHSTTATISPDAWVRQMNTYKARNLLVNKTVDQMTSADWTTIKTLATNGLLSTDPVFTMKSADANDLVGQTAWAPARLLISGWEYVSERLVQDFKAGDARRTRNVVTITTVVNRSGRGFQYGTRYGFKPIENGGDYASTITGLAKIPVACSYEENELMLAEANIKLGQIEPGLQSIDKVRTFQNAALPAVAGTGLNAAQAYEELRKERRIGLINKNVSFYDARRWGVIKAGGGRTGAVVVGPSGVIDNNATIEYNYLGYWDVPKNELDFNSPNNPSVPVIGN